MVRAKAHAECEAEVEVAMETRGRVHSIREDVANGRRQETPWETRSSWVSSGAPPGLLPVRPACSASDVQRLSPVRPNSPEPSPGPSLQTSPRVVWEKDRKEHTLAASVSLPALQSSLSPSRPPSASLIRPAQLMPLTPTRFPANHTGWLFRQQMSVQSLMGSAAPLRKLPPPLRLDLQQRLELLSRPHGRQRAPTSELLLRRPASAASAPRLYTMGAQGLP